MKMSLSLLSIQIKVSSTYHVKLLLKKPDLCGDYLYTKAKKEEVREVSGLREPGK